MMELYKLLNTFDPVLVARPSHVHGQLRQRMRHMPGQQGQYSPQQIPIDSHPVKGMQAIPTDLPLSKGYNSIIVIADHGMSKAALFFPCHKTISAEQMAVILYQELYKRFRLPDIIISDWCPQFAAKTTKELGRILGIDLRVSIAFHLQTDGQTEQTNQSLEGYLHIICGTNPGAWADKLADAEFMHNSRMHESLRTSPFEVIYGYMPKAFSLAFSPSHIPSVQELFRRQQALQTKALAAHKIARQCMMERSRQQFSGFQKREKVWLEVMNLKLVQENQKFVPRRTGLFEIIEVLSPVIYWLALPSTWRIHNVFHASLLTPYRETEAYGPNFPQSPPDLIGEGEEYKVEAILGHRR